MDWFLYDNGLHHERVNTIPISLENNGWILVLIKVNIIYICILNRVDVLV